MLYNIGCYKKQRKLRQWTFYSIFISCAIFVLIILNLAHWNAPSIAFINHLWRSRWQKNIIIVSISLSIFTIVSITFHVVQQTQDYRNYSSPSILKRYPGYVAHKYSGITLADITRSSFADASQHRSAFPISIPM
jgi:hypothetical protein